MLFPSTKIITPFIYHVSLSQKFHMAKRIVSAMLKKRRERKEKNIHAKRHERKKYAYQRAWRKKQKRNKDNLYFQIKCIHSKRKRFMNQRSTKKYLELGLYEKFHTLALLDQSVWLASPWGPVFDLAKYAMQVCLKFHTYP